MADGNVRLQHKPGRVDPPSPCAALLFPLQILLAEALHLIHKQTEQTAIKTINLIAKAARLLVVVFFPAFGSLKHIQSLLYVWCSATFHKSYFTSCVQGRLTPWGRTFTYYLAQKVPLFLFVFDTTKATEGYQVMIVALPAQSQEGMSNLTQIANLKEIKPATISRNQSPASPSPPTTSFVK